METTDTPERSNFNAPITLTLVTCMLLATLPALSFPKVDKLFNPASGVAYPWQLITGSFIHGWAFLPPLIHLGANLALFFFVGPWTERLLGSARYLLLMLAAILAAGLVRSIPDFDLPGASAFVLATGPVLLYRWMAIRNDPELPAFYKFWLGLLASATLVLVPLIYGIWLARQSNAPLLAFVQANGVHLASFLLGGLAVLIWRARIHETHPISAVNAGTFDRAVTIFASLLPAGMAVLIILGALKKL